MNQIYDKHGQSMAFYPEVPSILLQLHRSKVHIAAASRTSAPRACVHLGCMLRIFKADSLLVPCRARQALTELLVPGSLNSVRDDPMRQPTAKDQDEVISSIKLFETMEIYPGAFPARRCRGSC